MNTEILKAPSAQIPVFTHWANGSIDIWLSACAAIFELAPMEREDVKKLYALKAWYADPITIINSQYHGMITRHSNWHVEEAGAQIHVHRYASGRASVETDGRPVECNTGDITLLDYSRPFTSLHTHNDCHSFFVPHNVVNYTPSDTWHAPVYKRNSTIGRLIGQEMDHLLRVLRGGAETLDPRDIQRFLGCVEVGLSPNTATQNAQAKARESLKIAIQRFIEQNVHQTELSVSFILQNFGVSRASLYRMFEPDDGVRNYISRRRLYHAVANIAENPLKRGQIHEVAMKWGFSSDANFNRAVRREFGVAPGSLFKMPLRGPDDMSPLSFVQAKMNRAARRARLAA